jgi:FtsH-binding integral membrane protein
MLVAAYRALSWRRISQRAQLVLLLVVLLAAWELLHQSGHVSLVDWLLFALCAFVGLVVGFVWGQAMPVRYDPREHDAVCRRGGFLIFCWAAVALAITVLHTAPVHLAAGWPVGLMAALLLLTTSFFVNTLTMFMRVGGVRREREFYAPEEAVSS